MNNPPTVKLFGLSLGLALALNLPWEAPKPRLILFWASSTETSTATIDHRPWQELLTRYLDTHHPSGIHRFAYSRVSAEDKGTLHLYLSYLQGLDPRRYNKAKQRAYWINLYNALTVKLILDHYPVSSIREIHRSFFAIGPWDDPIAVIAGERLTLNDIEHGILRPIWKDPRLHYAVNCASLGCPNLASRAYTAGNTDTLLEEGARSYINHPRGVRFAGGTLILSSIYHWFKEDFGNSDAVVKQHLLQYAAPALASQIRAHQGAIDHGYDWGLNQP